MHIKYIHTDEDANKETIENAIKLLYGSMMFSWGVFTGSNAYSISNYIILPKTNIDAKITFGRSRNSTLPAIISSDYEKEAKSISREHGSIYYDKDLGIVCETKAKNETYLLLPRSGKYSYDNLIDKRDLLRNKGDKSTRKIEIIASNNVLADENLLFTLDKDPLLIIYMGKKMPSGIQAAGKEYWGKEPQPCYRLRVDLDGRLFTPENLEKIASERI